MICSLNCNEKFQESNYDSSSNYLFYLYSIRNLEIRSIISLLDYFRVYANKYWDIRLRDMIYCCRTRSDPIVHILSLSLRRILIGTLPAGCDTPLPKPLSVKSSCMSLPSFSISQSNRLTIKAVVSNI